MFDGGGVKASGGDGATFGARDRSMTHLVVLVASIAVVDSLNPTTILVALAIATGTRPVRGVLGFAAGFFAFNLCGGVVVLLAGHAIAAHVSHPAPELVHRLELGIGVTALAGAAILWRRRHEVREGFGRIDRIGHRFTPIIGATVAAIEFPTAFPYFAVIVTLVASAQPATVDASLLVLFNVIFMAPVVAIAVLRSVAGIRAVGVLTAMRRFAFHHAGSLLTGLIAAVGVVLVVLGVVGLTRTA